MAGFRLGSVTNSGSAAGMRTVQPRTTLALVILAVIPPGTTCKTGGDLADGSADLTCEDSTKHHPLDGEEPTHNRSVAGSSFHGGAERKWLL